MDDAWARDYPALKLPAGELNLMGIRAARGSRRAESRALAGLTPLVSKLSLQAMRRFGLHAHVQDLFHDAMTEALKAIRRYDGRAYLTTYVGVCVAKRLQSAEFALTRYGTSPRPPRPPRRHVPSNHDHTTHVHNPTEMEIQVNRSILLDLDPTGREVLRRWFGIGGRSKETYREIADAMGLSRDSVRGVLRRAVACLQAIHKKS
jgi:RNA polymerase sigma factor (sigma-70 family)